MFETNQKYKFDSLNHGFEPIKYYPELHYNFGSSDNVFVKILSYSNDCNNLMYWYSLIITNNNNMFEDDRIKILSGSYNFYRESSNQNKPHTKYYGLISNDDFAESLLKHSFGTLTNDSLKTDSIERYNQNIGINMRSEFPNIYK